MPRIALRSEMDESGKWVLLASSGFLACITYFPIDSEHEGSLLLAPCSLIVFFLCPTLGTLVLCTRGKLKKAVTRSAQK
ncbi:hypothetical protein BKA57DRAFT_477555 [Linnemannia elongata]|nr:hypothetical protein BKA57DRAFT_477555 [Linnemannia elongata]